MQLAIADILELAVADLKHQRRFAPMFPSFFTSLPTTPQDVFHEKIPTHAGYSLLI
jgi:hypothetical protein